MSTTPPVTSSKAPSAPVPLPPLPSNHTVTRSQEAAAPVIQATNVEVSNPDPAFFREHVFPVLFERQKKIHARVTEQEESLESQKQERIRLLGKITVWQKKVGQIEKEIAAAEKALSKDQKVAEQWKNYIQTLPTDDVPQSSPSKRLRFSSSSPQEEFDLLAEIYLSAIDILRGELFYKGEKVRMVEADNKSRRFHVLSVSASEKGAPQLVAIRDLSFIPDPNFSITRHFVVKNVQEAGTSKEDKDKYFPAEIREVTSITPHTGPGEKKAFCKVDFPDRPGRKKVIKYFTDVLPLHPDHARKILQENEDGSFYLKRQPERSSKRVRPSSSPEASS